jgi:hypothetical protein
LLAALGAEAQVYTPKVLAKGQPDTANLEQFARGIYSQAGAKTPRERAEAIWRYFLTDGRYVEPGFFYHIAGWAYEEPMGEVLDPLKLLNSYGFGLCYHIAPLLASVWKAGGFEDARVWFLTGHTVAEVYYEGGYHHVDSDMMGYNTVGSGPAKDSRVASVQEIERTPAIMLGKLKGPRQTHHAVASGPWYPADVAEDAIDGLVELFTTTADNWLFPRERSSAGHTMEFTLRPGERLIRYFHPERDDHFYLPHKLTGDGWEEFPTEPKAWPIFTRNGPKSQKDSRRWATGAIEYRPPVPAEPSALIEVRSPYVIIGAGFQLQVESASKDAAVTIETSTDDGRTWQTAGRLQGIHTGEWSAEPAPQSRSDHGVRTAVSGRYGYLLRLTRSAGVQIKDLLLTTKFQLNPRALPALKAGRNEFVYTAGPQREWRRLFSDAARAREVAQTVTNAQYVSSEGQGYWTPLDGKTAEFVFRLSARPGEKLTCFRAGGRFLDLSGGVAPDKFTAEVRKVTPVPAKDPAASIAWGSCQDGPFQEIWSYVPPSEWKDGEAVDRLLLWPEVDRQIAVAGQQEVCVRYRTKGLAVDDFRLSVETKPEAGLSPLQVTHRWRENGTAREFTREIAPGNSRVQYEIDTPSGAGIENEAIIFTCPN